MIPALLATVLFSFSVVFANRSTRVLGAALSNLCRLVLAAVFLAFWAHSFGMGTGGGAFTWFFFSGVVGFGLGDLALYLALPRVGPRLTALLMQCLAAPVAASIEWLWLDTRLRGPQVVAAAVILLGVAVAVAPHEYPHLSRRALILGVLFGVIAAAGQGIGAVLSRKAYLVVSLHGASVDGLTATYQRILGGLAFSLVPCLWLIRSAPPSPPPPSAPAPNAPRWFSHSPPQAALWVLLNTLAGPTFGVACYQWALETTPSGLVLPIVATMPIAVIPLAAFLDRDRPSPQSVLGGFIAIAGVIALSTT